ncbi:MAG: hypothetical protein ACR2F6_08795 [Mycobacteriales bacterium]
MCRGARETAFLSPAHRRQLDGEIGPLLGPLSDQQARASAARISYRQYPRAETLYDDGSTPARVHGFGPIPAPTARRLAVGERSGAIRRLRRVYTRRGVTIGMDSRARRFTPAQRELIMLRDHTCRTPHCDAAIRHTDHVRRHADNGPTSVTKAQGLCEGGNYRKEHPDWRTVVIAGGDDGAPHTTRITTPSGLSYESTAPPPLGHGATSDPIEPEALRRWTG